MTTNLFPLFLAGALSIASTASGETNSAPEAAVSPARQQVVGALFFREDCATATFEHPVLPGSQVLQVFLTDADNNVMTDGIVVKPDGTFAIPDVQPGTYYVRIQAENLSSFWDGASYKMVPVMVTEQSASVSVGNLCVDNDRPMVAGIDVVKNGAPILDSNQLSFHARVYDFDHNPVRLAWTVNTGELVQKNDSEVEWINTEGATQVLLELTVADDHGAEHQILRVIDVGAEANEMVAKR